MRKILIAASILSLLLSSALCASAHTGRTDSNGGHTNHSTGEYHYHHGYPEHNHYDMDGDGDTDCPYDFDNQTGINSGSNTAGNYYSSSRSGSTDNVITKTETIVQTVKEEIPYIPSWMYWIIGILAFVFLCSLVVIKWKNDDIRNWEARYTKATNEHDKTVAEITAANAAEIDRLTQIHASKVQDMKKNMDRINADNHALFTDLISQRKQFSLFLSIALRLLPAGQANRISYFRQELSKGTLVIPDDVYFLEDSTPVTGEISSNKPFGAFTVYVSQKGTCYHTDYYCSGYFSRTFHAYEVIERLRPCKKCAEGKFTGIPDWYVKIKSLTKEG